MKENLHLPHGRDGKLWLLRPAAAGSGMHRHDELELNLVLRGSGSYLLDDRRYELCRGTLVWLFPDQNHVLLTATTGFEMWVAVFRHAMVRRTCATQASQALCDRRPIGSYCKELPASKLTILDALFQQVASSAGDRALFNAGLAYSMLVAWAAYDSVALGTHSSEVHPAVERAITRLRNDPESLSLRDLARSSGLSPSHLSSIFKKQAGLTISAFRNRVRLERFFTLYGEGRQRTATEAALGAGFGSYAQFYRVFTASVGQNPQAYRRHRTNSKSVSTS